METLDRLLSSLRAACAGLPDKRRGANLSYEMADIGLAAFSVFFMQSPSFLTHQRHLAQGQGRSSCQTLFAMRKIPSDNHVRAMLDPVAPRHFDPVFGAAVAELERSFARKRRCPHRWGPRPRGSFPFRVCRDGVG